MGSLYRTLSRLTSDMITAVVLLTSCLIVSTNGLYGCECNGQGNSRGGPPCSTGYGEGLDGNPEYNRWCYVDRSNTNCDSRPSRIQQGLYWSYDGCYEEDYDNDNDNCFED